MLLFQKSVLFYIELTFDYISEGSIFNYVNVCSVSANAEQRYVFVLFRLLLSYAPKKNVNS